MKIETREEERGMREEDKNTSPFSRLFFLVPLPSLDPRYAQILTLLLLAMVGIVWLDFGPQPLQLATSLCATLVTQFVCLELLAKRKRLRAMTPSDFLSPFITGLGITLLLRSEYLWVYALAGFLAIASKFIIRINKKHIFNPANFAIAALLLFAPNLAWASPSQWGAVSWLVIFVLCFGMAVLTGAKRLDTTLLFFLCYVGLLFARALYLGDPIAIPLRQIQNIALLIFAFFMISDPMSTPNAAPMRFVFVLLVSIVAFYMQFKLQIRPALILALFFVSPITPLLDMWVKGKAYSWKKEKIA
jgi:enediyne biosynthesis protein E5